ncbi:MAG TPA: SDR family oxidoreductase [bacterium]|nr:SDR family oxidoreductase [bacterium]
MKLTPSTRVLVTGASGSLGWVVARMLAARCQVTSTYLSHAQVPEGTTGVRMDLADKRSIETAFEGAKPQIVIHSAAVTDPDACERDPKTAFKVNFEATHALTSLARKAGGRVVFISTDLVFDGAKGNYAENDQPCPLSIYGMAKLRAEEAVLGEEPGSVVLRSALIYGFGSPNSRTFLGRLVEVLASGGPAKLFTDQLRSPVLVDDLAQGAVLAIQQDLAGLFHLGGGDAVSRHEFGQQVCRVFGFDKRMLVPTRMMEFEALARRPLDATLDSSKFARATGFAACALADGLERAKRSQLLD